MPQLRAASAVGWGRDAGFGSFRIGESHDVPPDMHTYNVVFRARETRADRIRCAMCVWMYQSEENQWVPFENGGICGRQDRSTAVCLESNTCGVVLGGW